ncbi:MAG: glycerophosphodiester phosphodiesterase family protein [Chloroflexota bacterium]
MMDWLTATRPLIIGHRGASADAPENSLQAFALAMAQGADGVELDVQLSADGRPVIIHDDTVDRTTDGAGSVADLLLAELRDLDCGNGQPVPTLDDLFDMLGSGPLYNIELKPSGITDKGLEAAVADCVQAHGMASRVLISSFSPLALRRARRHFAPSIPLGLLREREATRSACKLLGVQADHPHHSLINAATMEWATTNGYRVNTWTVDDPAEARRLIDLGVHGIITNSPGALRAALSG